VTKACDLINQVHAHLLLTLTGIPVGGSPSFYLEVSMSVDWSITSSEDMDLITQCVKRVKESEFGTAIDSDNIMMDLQATHIAKPLKLSAMVQTCLVDLTIELMYIQYHIDRPGGTIGEEYRSKFMQDDQAN